MSPHLDHEVSQVPVTALAQPYNTFIFAGQGPILKIFDQASSVLVYSSRIFAKQAIHGITWTQLASDHGIIVLAWGGRNIFHCELTLETSNKASSGYEIYVADKQNSETSDWIFDVVFSPVSRSNEPRSRKWTAVFVTAHNNVFELRHCRPDTESETSLENGIFKLFAGPRCGLYSASLKFLSSTQLLVVSGTAFGEIVVWSLQLQRSSVLACRHYIFTGHEGSIFGVTVSDEMVTTRNEKLRLLASCSDDRTIRVWNITNLDSGIDMDMNDIEVEAGSTRTTGFLNYVSEDAAATSSQLCIATGMGHLSRIWDIRFAIERQISSHPTYVSSIISVGEDATCQKWQLIGHENENTYRLINIAISALHDGKNIWSMAGSEETLQSYVWTGGADGKIVEHLSLKGASDDKWNDLANSEWDIADVLQELDRTDPRRTSASAGSDINETELLDRKKSSTKDSFRSFAAIGASQVLLTTNEGLVLLATCDSSKKWTWKQIAAFDGLRGYSVACHLVAEPFEYVFFGDSQGNIYYYHSFFEDVKFLTNVEGKITKLIAEILPSRTHEYMSIVVTMHGGHPPVQLRINLGTGGTIYLASTKIFAKWTPSFPQITSAVVAVYESAEKGLIIGCRNGTIYSYSRLESSDGREFDSELPLSHGKEAVTAMVWHPHKGRQEDIWNPSFGWLFSVGRDGTLAVHHFNGHYRNPIMVHKLLLSFGPNLEGVAVDPTTLDITVWGFTSKYFIFQNMSAQEDVVTIECGGAHRIWNFAQPDLYARSTTLGLFAWIKAMKLNIAKIDKRSHNVIQSGGHGREIKTCAAAPCSIVLGLGPLIATGAEDTDIAISYFADWHAGRTQLKRLTTLRKHVTGVQSLHWSSDAHFLFSCGGFEEFYVWHLRPAPAVGVGIVCESKCPLENPDSELRITDFAVRAVELQQQNHLGEEQWVFLISLVYSDSSIKVWKYTSNDTNPYDRQAWSFIASTQYTTACLTAASFLSSSSTGWPLVSSATDGHLSFWSLSDKNKNRKLTCDALQPLHQNSIKTLSALELGESTWMIISGGDDNALGFTIFTWDEAEELFNSSSLLIPSAHAAAVTAVGLVAKGSKQTSRSIIESVLVTASNDQVVKLWNVSVDTRKPGTKGLEVRRIGKFASAVADISSLAIFRIGRSGVLGGVKVLVGGVGCEVWSIDLEDESLYLKAPRN